MEWNGNGYGTRIGHYGLDWALGSGGSMMTDDDDVSPYFLPTDTLVRSSVLTHVLYRVLHGSPPSWWWWWMTVCVAIGWRDGPGMWTLNLDRWDHYYYTTTTTRPSTQLRGGPSTTIQPINNVWTTTTTSVGPLVNRQRHGGEIVLCRCFTCSSIMKTNTRGPIVDQCEPGHQTVHSTPLIGSSLGMRRWYRFRRPICRAHDRPPSRTTKTATLFTNPATSWQIDVREYVNTLIVVDLSKPQIDWSIDRSDRLPTVSAHSLSLPLFTSTRISSFLAFNFSSRLFDIYMFLCIFHSPLKFLRQLDQIFNSYLRSSFICFFFIRKIVNFVHLKNLFVKIVLYVFQFKNNNRIFYRINVWW